VAALENENCDNNDAIFRTSLLTSSRTGNGYFDDFAVYDTYTNTNQVWPSGAVVAFNLGACPAGWLPFGGAIGKFIIGSGVAPAKTYTNVNGDAGHTWTFPGATFNNGTSSDTVGAVPGYYTWQMNVNEIPAHTHPLKATSTVALAVGAAEQVVTVSGVNPPTVTSNNNLVSGTAPYSGLTGAINTDTAGTPNVISNLPPYYALLYCVKN
jgi:microcystin-dependent protein